jgi:SAM-dependent methyltransferase
MAERTWEELVAEGESVPVDGWDFSWFAGRATEERPSWGYTTLIGARMAEAQAALDIQTGGGEVLATISRAPAVLAATDSWPPNLEIARRNLAPFGATVVEVPDDAALPFESASFDLVVSRHPVVTVWEEVARVLRPGGTFLSQQIGAGTNRELTEFMMGTATVGDARSTERAKASAEAVGLTVVDLRHESLKVVFFDVAAVVYFLRKVIWTVPGFTVGQYRERLAAMHEHIQRHGSFVSHAERFLIEARKVEAP